MNTSQTAIDLRPLESHSCTDLGFALARQWYWSLLVLYLMVFTPLLILAAIAAYLAPDYLWVISAVLWWFKPLGELALLTWCSQALFAGGSGYKTHFYSAYKSLPRLLLNYLGLARISPTRGFSMCVVFLEKTGISKGGKRLEVLSGSGGALSWVWLVGTHIEIILAVGAGMLLYYFVPMDTPLTEEFGEFGLLTLADYFDSALYMFCAFAAQLAFAPFFVCASFVHYINRRSRLEGWDIQHAFHALNTRVKQERQPLSKKVSSLLSVCVLSCVLAFASTPQFAQADGAEQAAEAIQSVLKQERFGHTSESGRLRLREKDAEADDDSGFDFDFEWLKKLFEWMKSDALASGLLLLGAALLGFFVFKLLRRYWPFIRGVFAGLAVPRRAASGAKSQADIQLAAASFEQARQLMLSGETRAALACLLRAVIDAAKQHPEVHIDASHTEQECAVRIAASLDDTRQTAFRNLLQVWRKQAYAGQDVAALYADKVIRDCELAFSEKAS